MAARADLVAGQPFAPAPDLVAYPWTSLVDPVAREPFRPAPDLVAYPWAAEEAVLDGSSPTDSLPSSGGLAPLEGAGSGGVLQFDGTAASATLAVLVGVGSGGELQFVAGAGAAALAVLVALGTGGEEDFVGSGLGPLVPWLVVAGAGGLEFPAAAGAGALGPLVGDGPGGTFGEPAAVGALAPLVGAGAGGDVLSTPLESGPPASSREPLRRAAWRRLRGIGVFGGRVYLDRAEALAQYARHGDLPALLVSALGETVERSGEAPREYRRTLRLGVELLVARAHARPGARAGDRVADVEGSRVDRLGQVVKRVLLEEPTLGGRCDSVNYARRRTSYVDEGEVAIAGALLEFEVVYYTEHREWGELLAGPWRTAVGALHFAGEDRAGELIELQRAAPGSPSTGTTPSAAQSGLPHGPLEVLARLVRLRLVDRTRAGKRVRLDAPTRVDDFRDYGDPPLLVVWTTDEDAGESGAAPHEDRCVVRLSVLAFAARRHARAGAARAGDRVAASEADEVDRLCRELEAALLSEPTLSGFAADLELVETTFAHVLTEDGLAAARVDFELVYFQEVLEAQLAQAGDFLLAAETWLVEALAPIVPTDANHPQAG